ncbi:MAG TPA: glycosyltransferase [Bryobacteraceae bacterium]|jgi:cellulose synthase/poly-beta-1,6-N-acetylglucosamine synthase-like glycosyltransferase|nr:glycosyltransferase [Bryobacteraceae bacterium]
MPVPHTIFALLLVSQPLAKFITNGLFDDTFSGIYQLSFFDWSLLVPYFGILIILSVYGLHRYETMRRYIKHRKKLPREAPTHFAELPKVTVQLPLYNERFVVARLLEETMKLDYPRELLQIQVLDDSTDETHPYTERLCNEYRAAGFPVEYRHRTNRHGYKAGALQEGLDTATGELIAIFDADFLPPADFLRRTIHFFADPQVGVVQTRWSYINKEFNILTQVEAMLLDGHFVLEHGARCGAGLFFNFNGTAGILRRTMIDDAGGWQHETLTEDSDLSYRAQLNGWRFVYVPGLDCPSELPVETYGFQVQQSRWAKGLTQVAKKLLPRILKADLPLRVKIEAVMHLTPNISYPLMIVVSALMLPVMIVRFYMGWVQMVLIDFPLIIASFWSISAFYLYAQKELYPRTWWKSIAFLPMLMAAGVALTISNTKAVLEAILGIQTSFARTPKYAIGTDKTKVRTNTYRRRSGWLPYIELAIGSYFLYMVDFAIETYNFLAIPFLMLFVCGYYWAGISTLYQEFRDKLAWQKARKLAETN